MVAPICFILTRPMNINNKLVAPTNNAVDKLAGAIKTHVTTTGIITGRKPFLKSFITSCFLLSILPKYINNASFAKSEVWKVRLMIGSFIQRLPSFKVTPKNNVHINKGIAIKNNIRDHFLYIV